MVPKIVITNRVHPDVVQLLQARCRIEMNVELEPWSCEELVKKAGDSTGMIAFMTDCIDGRFLAHRGNRRADGRTHDWNIPSPR